MAGRRITRRHALKLTASMALALGPARAGADTEDGPLYRDPLAPVHLRVADLLERMTLDEKVAQMLTIWAGKAEVMDGLEFDPARAAAKPVTPFS